MEKINVNIPDNHKESLNNFFSMSDKERDELISVLYKLKDVFSLSELIEKIKNELEFKDIDGIIYMLLSFYSFVHDSYSNVNEAIDNIIYTSKNLNFINERKDEKKIKSQFEKILNDNYCFNIISKKIELKTDFKNIYYKSKILTDLRPIFKSNIDEKPLGAILVHNLKLKYFTSGDDNFQEIYITLDNEDIDDLIDVLKRAKQKSNSLCKNLEKDDFCCFIL